MNPNNFSLGLSEYLNNFQFSNASLSDLIHCLKNYFDNQKYGFTLDEWVKSWIMIKGLNSCEVIWGESQFSVIQETIFPNKTELRYHKMSVAFYDDNAKVYGTQEIMILNKKETVFKTDLINLQTR